MNSEKDSTLTGFKAGPLSDRPMITGPTASDCFGNWELSISFKKTPGETNLNFFSDIVMVLLFKLKISRDLKLESKLLIIS